MHWCNGILDRYSQDYHQAFSISRGEPSGSARPESRRSSRSSGRRSGHRSGRRPSATQTIAEHVRQSGISAEASNTPGNQLVFAQF